MHGLVSPIIHRDIKLENILLTSTTQSNASIKLADFGLAVQMAHRETYPQEEALQKLDALRTGMDPNVRKLGHINCGSCWIY